MATDENKKVEAYKELGKQLGINKKLTEDIFEFDEKILDLAKQVEESKKKQVFWDKRRDDLSVRLIKYAQENTKLTKKYNELDKSHVVSAAKIRSLRGNELSIEQELTKLTNARNDSTLTDQAKYLLYKKTEYVEASKIANAEALQETIQIRKNITDQKKGIREIVKANAPIVDSLTSQLNKAEEQLRIEEQLTIELNKKTDILKKQQAIVDKFRGITNIIKDIGEALRNPSLILSLIHI